MTDQNNTMIEMKSVTKNYTDPQTGRSVQVLKGIDLKANSGNLYSIVGPSGSGKSTILKILGGMTNITTGELVINDTPIHALDRRAQTIYLRLICGFLWQSSENNIIPNISIKDNILTKMQIAGFPRNKRKERVKELLDALELNDRSHHKFRQISGGEANRASIAISIANKPKILLADEPTSELDSVSTNDVIKYLKAITKEQDITTIVVTHDSHFIRSSDKSLLIEDGIIAGYYDNRDEITKFDAKQPINWVDKYGRVKIPNLVRRNLAIENVVGFNETQNQSYSLTKIKNLDDSD